jgi:pimeloyl-ACP methyl ester carboxylesterase
MANKVAAAGMASIAELATYRTFHPNYLASHPRSIEERRAVLVNVDPIAFAAACSVLVNTDLTAQLKSLRAATLVVCGAYDQATPPALNRQIANAVPGARYIEIPDCGHCPPLEQPAAFLAAIRDFIGLPKEAVAPSGGAKTSAPAPVRG